MFIFLYINKLTHIVLMSNAINGKIYKKYVLQQLKDFNLISIMDWICMALF